MSDANVRVVLTGHGRGEVFIDGVKVPGVKSVVISSGDRMEGSTNAVVLTLIPRRIEFEGVAAVTQAQEYDTPATEEKPMTIGDLRMAGGAKEPDGCGGLATIACEMRGYAAKGLAPDKEVLRYWAMVLSDVKQ